MGTKRIENKGLPPWTLPSEFFYRDLLGRGIFLPGLVQAAGQDTSRQFTLIIPDLNVYPLSIRFKGDGTAYKGHQAYWLLDPWFVGGNGKMVRGCLDKLYQDCIKAFGPNARTEALLKAQCSRAAQWRVSDTFNANAGDNNTKWTIYKTKNSKLMNSVECLSDTDGRVTGKLGCRNITFRPNIKINLLFGQDKSRQ